jgi:hypothetical protein
MRDIGVLPRDDNMRKHLKHPIGRRFENYPDPTPWPFDQFTMRRLEEGAIIEAPPKPQV